VSTVLSEDEQATLTREHSHITFSQNAADLARCNTYIVCVPTPVHKDHTPDISALVEASQLIGTVVKPGDLVIVESTIAPGMSEDTVIPIIEHESGLDVERDFYYAYCPERINPGDSRYTVKNIPRVLGAAGPESLRRGRELYETLLEAEVKPMPSIMEAEAVKMVENSFRDLNIAFVNELAVSFERAGIDTISVIDGAATKPFAFMAHYPGCGVGGHCIPVDPYYLIQFGSRNGTAHHLLATAREVNERMPEHTIELLRDAVESRGRSLSEERVAVLGLAYKRGIADTRESPAIEILNGLHYRGVPTIAFDPYNLHLSTSASLDDALTEATAVIIATNHHEFCSLTPQDFSEHGIDVVVDGRNCLDWETFRATPGLTYRSIGHAQRNDAKSSRERA
jgi:nucleotide sugar dehydrogenase